MATFTANEQGIVRVPFVVDEETSGSFGLNGWDGVPFAPGEAVEIPNDRLASLTKKVLAPLGAVAIVIAQAPG
jgi:hypothetical protein